ncbi:MAG: glycosyltransferase family 9 protein, partial [Ignavibacteriales bacterium]|nr:glycosyltransferase family 9 protein [Ignavibacteriales bacterium]
FFEKLIEQIIAISKPKIDVENINLNIALPKNYAIIFPGAGAEKRKWKAENFAETAKFIHSKYKYEIVLAGSKNDIDISKNIISSLGFEAINLAGKSNLVELSKVISDAKILVSNETGSTHIAAAVGCPFVCISNGNHYGRFNPYPSEMYSNCIYIYPEEITNEKDKEKLLEKFRFGSDLDINSIPCKLVIDAIEKLLK